MDGSTYVDDEQSGTDFRGLIGIILGLALGGAVLYVAGGPPHLPHQLPSWTLIVATLKGSSLPLDALAYVLTTAAWLVWLWIVASLLLRLMVAAADALARGASWVHTVRVVSNRITLPFVRRAVDGALVAVFVVNMASRTVSGAAAAAPPRVAPHAVAIQPRTSAHGSPPSHDQKASSPDVQYTVQPDDTLWGIAQRFYGSGEEYPRLVAANVGRRMADGAYFTQTGVIQPGWVLRIPLASAEVQEENGVPYYVVQEGDTLQWISARLLGSDDRWTELFQLNRGTARLNGFVLTDPNLIWPGLRLRLPAAHPATGPPHAGGGTTGRPSPKPSSSARPTPPRPTPSATSAPPTTTPSPAVLATPVRVPTSTPSTGSGSPDDTALIYGVAGAAVAAGAGAAALFMRRRVRRSLDEPPVPVPRITAPPGDDFLDAEPERPLAHRLYTGEREPVVSVAEQVARCLDECGLEDVSVLWAEQGRNAVTVLLRAGVLEVEQVAELAEIVGRRLAGKGRAVMTPGGDVALHVSELKVAALAALHGHADVCQPLLPLGNLPGGETLFVNWRELGHVLIVSLPGEGADVALTSLLAALAARCRPDELRLWTIAGSPALPAQLQHLPHQCGAIVDPGDEERVTCVLSTLRTALVSRMRQAENGADPWQPTPEEPELVLVAGELAALPEEETTLEMIGTHGAEYGVRLVAATTRADAVDGALTHFDTRLVLLTFDDEESIRLLGQPEAADLGPGELFVRIDGRAPLRLRGFRVSPGHLEALLRLMQEAYDRSPVPSPVDGHGDEPRQADRLDREAVVSTPGGSGDEEEVNADEVTPEREPADLMTQAAPVGEPRPNGVCDKGVEIIQGDDAVESLASAGESGATGLLEGSSNGSAETGEERPCDGPLIDVQCFGGLVVRSGEREVTPSGEEGGAYKAWEILAFLAVHPGGLASREKLLAAVWPDIDTERAANRMRTAMGRLRILLAEQVPNIPSDIVRADRDGLCRLDVTLVTSDVHRFVSLLEQVPKLSPDEAKTVLEQARALYQGDLLAGRRTRGYDWVDERDESGVTLREHYREQYHRALQRLARLHYEEGRAELAVPLYKEILQAEPTLEDVVRQLYRCYANLGDLTSLIREERHLHRALRDAYAGLAGTGSRDAPVAPEPETVSLFEQVRAELEERAARRSAADDHDRGRGEGRLESS